MLAKHALNPKGFTLVELIVGIVVLSIALTLILSLVIPQARRSVDPIMQVRATELAQSLMNEISAKSFDENSDRVNGLVRCNEDFNPENGNLNDPGESACTDAGSFGEDSGEVGDRQTYDDVDDYHGLDQTGAAITNSLGGSLQVGGVNLYEGFRARVSVIYDGDYDGVADNIQTAKLITITVTAPSGDSLVFSSYRSNF